MLGCQLFIIEPNMAPMGGIIGSVQPPGNIVTALGKKLLASATLRRTMKP